METATLPPPRKTPLYEAHRRSGAKLIDFGGWLLPVHYAAGILAEHKMTRGSVGVFDVCHMGEIHLRGPHAGQAVQRLVTNRIDKLYDGRALYTVACHETGGIVDDLIVYRVTQDHYLLIVNAANIAKDKAHFITQVGNHCEVTDASDETSLIAFQGPKAAAALGPLTGVPLASLRPFHFVTNAEVAGKPVWIARTGYTGEDGFELVCSPADSLFVWDTLVDAASKVGGGPVGLGARDTLRLEARLPLYGNDLDDETTPLEAGLHWVVKFDAGNFLGRDALLRQKASGISRSLIGFEMRSRGIARHGYPILSAVNAPHIGQVTSGTVGPTVGKNIGMGYVPSAMSQPGTRLFIDCRGKVSEAEVVNGPFYHRAQSVATST